MFLNFTKIKNKMLINRVVVNETRLKNFVNLVNIKKMAWYNRSVEKGEQMEDKEFLIKKVEVLESAIKQIAVIQYELDKKLGELEGLE